MARNGQCTGHKSEPMTYLRCTARAGACTYENAIGAGPVRTGRAPIGRISPNSVHRALFPPEVRVVRFVEWYVLNSDLINLAGGLIKVAV